MITYDQALLLLKRYLTDEKTIKHCLGVADVAYEMAIKIKQKNLSLDINPEKVKIAALLHDIGRYKEGLHELNTVEVLKKEGFDDIAKIAMHGFIYETPLAKNTAPDKFLPKTIENKIIVLADMYYNQNEERVSLKERFEDIEKRYKNDKDFLQTVQLAKNRIQKLETEIKDLM